MNFVQFSVEEFGGFTDWSNHRRLLEPIGNAPAAELDAAQYRQLEKLTKAAFLQINGLRRTWGGSTPRQSCDLDIRYWYCVRYGTHNFAIRQEHPVIHHRRPPRAAPQLIA